MHIGCWNQYQSVNKQISQIGYSFTSTGKASVISAHGPGFHSRLRMKLSKVMRFYQITSAQDYRMLIPSIAEIPAVCHSSE